MYNQELTLLNEAQRSRAVLRQQQGLRLAATASAVGLLLLAGCGSGFGEQPPGQQTFVDAVVKVQEQSRDANNDLQQGVIYQNRDASICSVVEQSGKIEGWTGKVSKLSANGEGRGVVSIEIADEVHLSTWNNILSDSTDHTLVDKGPLLDALLSFEEGDVLRFSGQLVPDDGLCLKDKNLLEYSKLTRPDFVFRFTEFSAT